MKCLLIFAVCVAVVRPQGLFEPGVHLLHKCSGGPDYDDPSRTTVTTFDGSETKVMAPQKTLVAEWPTDETLICDYNIRVVTAMADEGLYYDWMGFGFGVHPGNNAKFRTSLVFGQSVTKFLERGHGFKGAETRNISAFYDQDGVVMAVLTDGVTVKLRSLTCPYAINWTPGVNKYDTTWEVWISDEYKDFSLGLCQNADDDLNNDHFVCPDDSGVEVEAVGTQDEQWQEISDGCVRGTGGPKVIA